MCIINTTNFHASCGSPLSAVRRHRPARFDRIFLSPTVAFGCMGRLAGSVVLALWDRRYSGVAQAFLLASNICFAIEDGAGAGTVRSLPSNTWTTLAQHYISPAHDLFTTTPITGLFMTS